MEAAMGIFGCAVVWLVVNLESENSLFLENPAKGRQEETLNHQTFKEKPWSSFCCLEPGQDPEGFDP